MLVRRTSLSPPRDVELDTPEAPPAAGASPRAPVLDRLAAPSTARERRRPLFHPRRGWFRRLERAASNALARSVYPCVPGMALPYGRILRRDLTLAETEVALPDLPASFDGVRVLLITDVHAGPFLSPASLERAFDRLLACSPDVVLLGGDLVTCRLQEFDTHRRAFRWLSAPLGVFAVLGNHDHYTGQAERLIERVEDVGIRVLHNRSVALERSGDRLWLAGVDDLLLGDVDLDAALAGTEGPVVLLSHNPDLLFEASRRDVALMLSGHTHGGQLRVPGLPVLVRQSKYRLDQGRYCTGATELVVSRGLGAVGIPWRCACPPEAVELTLRRRIRRNRA